MTQLILSGVTTVEATCQLVLGTHFVPADENDTEVLQLGLLPFETSLHPGKCVSCKCLYTSSSVLVHWPLGNLSIPSGAVLALSRSLHTIDISEIPSLLTQKSCQDSRLLRRNSFLTQLIANNMSGRFFLKHGVQRSNERTIGTTNDRAKDNFT